MNKLSCTDSVLFILLISFAELQSEKEELRKKYIHVMQILESEKTAKWQLLQQCEEQGQLVSSLKAEVAALRKQKTAEAREEESEEIRNIKKVQSLIRGWLCRRRWHSIVQNYIRSPHAESMRQRNSLCFQLVETESEYVQNLSTLVSCFFRPLKMAASSKKPPLSHEEVSCIFLNSETILFLHQIFLKGLHTRLESWPTLVLGDLFDMLLPMLSIYQEYVRNHHYSLQTLAECKQRPAFHRLLKLYEEKPACSGRTLEYFLTAPMHRVPAYIITLHDLLALTPHNHVERNTLEYAQSVLEELSTVMHDEVSETENIRKNLSIERQIVEGCDMLLDVNQIFIRQGNLIQITESRKFKTFGGLSLKPSEVRKETVRQCFLFSGYLLLTSRSSSGRLHLSKNGSNISLAEATLVDDCFQVEDAESIFYGVRGNQELDLDELTFKLIVRSRDKPDSGSPYTVTLMAPSPQEKAEWTSDISQCIENLSMMAEDDTVSVSSRLSLASVRSDPKLFTDDTDIKYCKALNCCKLPKIRHASLERLLERLLDIRFLSVDFLNAFLITYRVFTSASVLLDTLLEFYYSNNAKQADSLCTDLFPPVNRKVRSESLPTSSLSPLPDRKKGGSKFFGEQKNSSPSQSISITVSDVKMPSDNNQAEACTPSETAGITPDRLCPSNYHSYRRHSSPSALGETAAFDFPESTTDQPQSPGEDSPGPIRHESLRNHSSPFLARGNIRTRAQSSSSDFVSTGVTHNKLNMETNSKLSTSPVEDVFCDLKFELQAPPKQRPNRRSRALTPSGSVLSSENPSSGSSSVHSTEEKTKRTTTNTTEKELSLQDCEKVSQKTKSHRRRSSPSGCRDRGSTETPPVSCLGIVADAGSQTPEISREKQSNKRSGSPCKLYKIVKDAEERVMSLKSQRRSSPPMTTSYASPKSPVSPISSPRSPLSPSANTVSAGVVVTSSIPARRRSSISSAAAAFAAATAGASPSYAATSPTRFRFGQNIRELLSSNNHMATMRVLTVLRHWVTKHPEDFEADHALKEQLVSSMNYILNSDGSTNLEQKFAAAIIKTLERKHEELKAALSFELKLDPVKTPKTVELATFDKISATQIAEQLTFLEHLIFSKIPAHEFLNLSWMKSDKNVRAPNILRVTKRFNETSSLVASEILRRQSPSARATVIEKWATVGEVCRNLHNFNSVLEISSAFMSSSIFRLKKTWEKVSKQTRTLIDRLQKLVSSDGRFKNMREALRCADPPCVPYLGFYLTDLAFIEDGTPNSNENGLINFSKMRMIAQVIQEIKHYQQNVYTLEHDKRIIRYLTSKANLMDEDMLYRTSLTLEPRKRASSKLKQPVDAT
ncbi:ras-specific guanine nucleotide-releasing factor 2-like isoform X2 [Acropora millepora]|uniref:ras-specific guanine nucleotide-releasing factor 2-like isoform X2 n=1 Tax=Acropora millepora TaxID=45264 RepID=UPI0010FCB103|nr:ras-specific guanine nucleotide-releasing factor 2-like isoform X2 [Acropora millepora]